MKFLAREQELKTEGYTEKVLKEEALAVWKLQKAGVVREAYFKKNPKEAILVLECESVAEAKYHLKQLPLVKEGLIEFALDELLPYDGFDRLLNEKL